MRFKYGSAMLSVFVSFVPLIVVGQGSRPGGAPQRPMDRTQADARTNIWNTEVMGRDGMLPIQLARAGVNSNALRILREQAAKKLRVTKGERESLADLLKEPKTGILKLAPVVECSRMFDPTRPDNPCAYFFAEGKGLSYSFRAKKHVAAALSDLTRSDGEFYIAHFMGIGLIRMIGDVPIQKVTASVPEAAALIGFEPANSIAGLQKQKLEIAAEMTINGVAFNSRAPIRLGVTYLARSIAFTGSVIAKNPDVFKPAGFDVDPRKDLTFVFRLTEITPEGALLIVWKELERRDAPALTS